MNKLIDETGYHLDPLPCIGCNKLFAMTVRHEQDDKRYCADCWYHIAGLQDYQDLEKQVDPITWYLMNTPILEVPLNLLNKMEFVNLKYLERLDELRKNE